MFLMVVVPTAVILVVCGEIGLTQSFQGQAVTVGLIWIFLGGLWSHLNSRPKFRRLDLDAYLYLFPAIVILGVFHIIPVFYALVLSFYRTQSVFTDLFVGLSNYKEMLGEEMFWMSLRNTAWFVICTVPTTIAISLGIAVLLNSPIRGKGFYRTIYFLPVVTSVAAVSIVWKWVYNPQLGLLNYVLTQWFGLTQFARFDWLKQNQGVLDLMASGVGLTLPAWFPDGPSVAMLCVVVMSVWKGLGYNVVIFLAGLQNIPKELYEVARIDGAGVWQSFRNITWPLLTPTTYFILITTTISSFQVFAQIYMLYDGLPSDSTNVIVFYMYEVGIQKTNRFGYGSAVAYALFLIIFGLTLFQRRFVERRVHYN